MTGLLILATMAQLPQFVTYIASGIRRHFCVKQMPDGGYVCSGNLVATGYRFLLCRFDQNGNLMWYYYIQRTSSQSEDAGGQSFTPTYDGGFVVSGIIDLFDLGLAKFTSNGTFSWIKTLDLGSTEQGYSVIQTSDNGLVVTGYAGASDDILLTKFDASGTHLWTKTIGGSGRDEGRGVIQTSDGGLALVGFTDSWGAGGYDIILCRLNAMGDILWTRTLGGSGDDLGYCLIQTTDGGFVISGYTESFGAAAGDNILAKFDGSGNYLWTVVFGYGTTLDTAASVAEGLGGVLGVVSWSTPDIFSLHIPLTRFDANGNFLSGWMPGIVGNAFESRYSSPGIARTSDGGFVTTGETHLIKYDASGRTCMGTAVTPNIIFPNPTVTSPSPLVTTRTPTVSSPNYSMETPENTQFWPCNPLCDGDDGGKELSEPGFYLMAEGNLIRFSLPSVGYVQLSVYDPLGRLVARPLDGWVDAGEHEVSVEAGEGVRIAVLRYLRGTKTVRILN